MIDGESAPPGPTGGHPVWAGGPPPGPVPPHAPAPRRRWPLWAGLGLVLTVVLCSATVVLGVQVLDRLPAGADPSAAATGPAPSPRPGDPLATTQAWLRQRIGALLDQQAGALLRGDEAGWLAVADQDAAPLVADLKRRYAALRAMQVTTWRPTVTSLPMRLEEDGRVEWRVPVTVEHCFVVPQCRTGPADLSTRWADADGRPVLVAIEPTQATPAGPRPWEVSELVVQVGARTIVATTPDQRSRLPELLSESERAAAVADRFAVGGNPPDRYRIFYAGEPEWNRWYGGGRPEWTAGYVVPVGGDHYEVVLNAKDLHSSVLDDLLRHELTHVASLPGEGHSDGSQWWLVEGLADYAAAAGRPVSRYSSLEDVRRLVAQGSWTGQLAETEPRASADAWEVSARYGIGYLAVRHLVDRFGEERTLAFYRAVVIDRRSVEDASAEVLGAPWAGLHDACVAYIRGVVG
ncbi:basic secretory family protein [Polymorphospora rubra]|uniref:Peptidase MA superfamily n=1 Tax=Polymorphospora rubra TaxID=338584 RepID=A0A810N0G6_9ACTN|nr:basic secretory family protein [Polymorphospora rubra]BCJ66154.1 hypothetical protein Prubr_31750 [Polymorphospora rubra]